MPLHVPVPAVALEGDYSSWAHQWTNAFPTGLVTRDYHAVIINERAGIFIMGWRDTGNEYRFGVYNLSDMSVVFESPAASDYTAQWPDMTWGTRYTQGQIAHLYYGGATGSFWKYLVIALEDTHTIEIWKDGVMQQSINLQDYVAGCRAYGACMSLNGQYLIVTTDNPRRILLFEGS